MGFGMSDMMGKTWHSFLSSGVNISRKNEVYDFSYVTVYALSF